MSLFANRKLSALIFIRQGSQKSQTTFSDFFNFFSMQKKLKKHALD